MTTVRWHKEARQRIAPRTHEDLGNTENRWRLSEWQEIKRSMRDDASASDDDVAAALQAIKLTESRPPSDWPALEIECVMVLVGHQRTWQFFAEQCGAARVAAILTTPSLESSWEGQPRGYVVERKKGHPHRDLLRQLVLRQDSKGRAECRAAVESVWIAGDVAVHEQLAFAFFDHEPWRVQALAEILEQAPPFSNAQLTLARDVDTMRTLVARRKATDAIEYTEIVASLDAEAQPLLFELAKTATKRLHTSHTIAMSVMATEQAARHLASCISHPSTRDTIGAYFERHKDLASLVLPTASVGASRNAALAKALMMKVCPGAVVKEDTVSLDDPAVPNVLRDAPWRHPPDPLPKLLLGDYPTSAVLSESRKAEGLAWLAEAQRGLPEMTAEQAAAFAAAHAKDTYMWQLVDDGKCLPLELILDFFCQGKFHNAQIHLPLLAHFGPRALPGLRRPSLLSQIADDVLIGLDDPHLAHPLAVMILDEGSLKWPWFAAHPRAAAFGLLAAAHDATTRHASEIMLHRLADAGFSDVIREVAGDDAQVRAFLERDRRLDVVTAPKVATYPVTRPRLADGRALGDDVVERIFEMLAVSPPDETYAGIEDVKQACQARSLAEMAWDLAALADAAHRRSRSSRTYPDWMRFAVVHLADDEVIRRLTPALKHPAVYRVLQTLSRRGVRSALIELATAHERGDAPQSLDRLAQSLGQSRDELVETILPTTTLEAQGTTTLQFGTRTLRVGFDTTLAPILFSGEERLASLPRAKKDDDPIALRLARERWEELKEDVRTVAHLRMRSLEDAMRTARRIPASHFLAGWANHPLGKHHARGMVWAVERGDRGEALVTFRVAEDGTFADVHDEPLSLAETDVVRVPHPAELPKDVTDAWLRTFSDYGLIQPVPQLGRTPIAIEPNEASASELTRTLTPPAPYTSVARILREQGTAARTLTRCAGNLHFDLKTQWTDRKTLVASVKLTFRDANDTKLAVPLSKIDPVELAESLFVMRLLLEAT